jgi:hypothetical protein
MGRVDVLLGLAVGGFAWFVGSRVAEQRSHRRPIAVERAMAAHDRVEVDQGPASASRLPRERDQDRRPDVADVIPVQRGRLARVADPDFVRAEIVAATDGYLAEMIEADGGMFVRWPDRRETGLRIWVQSTSSVPDWNARYAQMARDAFANWEGAGLPARLDFVLDSAGSDIQVVWIDRFAPEFGRRVGVARLSYDHNGWLDGAQVSVAVHDSVGRTIDPPELASIVQHEAGHSFGLGHSKDSTTKMYPIELMNSITRADRATLRMLYQLPPGSIR